ncbi:hypothetical protein LJB42_002323 [Komagataella kurtzmanii]|nr:hypothetical protein LJB42_002323 [Komagataella kurtzmanii]
MTDRRRILGPLDASPLTFESESVILALEGEASSKFQLKKLHVSKPSSGDDKIFVDMGLVTNCEGSCYMEIDNTLIQVSVYGPRPIRGSFIDTATLSVECRFLPFLTESKEFANGNGRTSFTEIEQRLSSFVYSCFVNTIILSKYPKSSIDIFIKVISVDSYDTNFIKLTNYLVNCASLSIIDAQIEVKDIITAGYIPTSIVTSFTNLHLPNDKIVGLYISDDTDAEIDDEKVLSSMIMECNKKARDLRSSLNKYLIQLVK